MTTTDREARIAAKVAARSQRPDLTNAPRCTVANCANLLHRAGRCEAHWLPMYRLIEASLVEDRYAMCAKRVMADMLTEAGCDVAVWEDNYGDSAVLAEFADAAFAAGYRLARGPRGGRKLVRRMA